MGTARRTRPRTVTVVNRTSRKHALFVRPRCDVETERERQLLKNRVITN